MRGVIRIGAQALLSAGLLWWLLRAVDWAAFSRLFLALPASFLCVSLGVVLVGQALYAWRWSRLLSAGGIQLETWQAVRLYFVGIFVNNFLPGTVGGDVSKVYALAPRHGYRPVVASILVDRVLGLGLLAGFATITAWAVVPGSPGAAMSRTVVTLTLIATAAIVWVALYGADVLARLLAPMGTRASALGTRVRQFGEAVGVLVRSPLVLAQGAAVVATYFAAQTLIYLWFARLNGIAAPSFVATFAAVAAIGVLSNVPLSFNGLGVREQLHVWLFAPLGFPGPVALAVSLLLFGHILIASAVGFVWWRVGPAPAGAADA